ncbi:cytochrome C [Tenacibaculum todarodis]|uniref:Cytochrome C n=1 Tax=Tenacibaculum todarodis TaxID=1850252 RepID=A0A1L3JJP9_9FLAO|nr:heme-binding domain-containing protein [Tenacibaculum todarodis]APG65370.1 cytochrome C [Tenacibaculum todarodis]
MKIIKKIALVLLIILLISQFFGPEKNEGDVNAVSVFIAETNPPENVQKILKESCFDCHSNTTSYPWYNKITPVNYWLANHVKDGKKHLNFSEWNSYSLKRKEHKMKEVWEEVEKKKMPLDSYTWTHAEANLTPTQIEAVVVWGKKVQADYQQQLKAK